MDSSGELFMHWWEGYYGVIFFLKVFYYIMLNKHQIKQLIKRAHTVPYFLYDMKNP